MPRRVDVMAAVRNDAPVAVLVFVDVLDDSREMHLSPTVALELLAQLARFIQQIGVAP